MTIEIGVIQTPIYDIYTRLFWGWQQSTNLTQESRCINRSLSNTPSHQFGVLRVFLGLVFAQSVYIFQDLFGLLFVLLSKFFQRVFVHA
jgi:hypothetical protein